MSVQLDDFKARQRAVWDAGDYEVLARRIADVGRRVVAAAAIEPGMRVLDVACGTGNAALPAARAGAQVTGIDLVPKLLDEGRAKAEAEGLEIEWLEGDAEELPFGDAEFDRVISTFGHMFAPRHQRVADEMVRVCREGGAIVTATWTPEGATGELLRTSAAYLPPPPDYASPPLLWGTEDHVRELLGPSAKGCRFERHLNRIEADSIDAWADVFMTHFPPMVIARTMLGERFAELRERIMSIWRRANEADDGTLRLPQEYLLTVVRL